MEKAINALLFKINKITMALYVLLIKGSGIYNKNFLFNIVNLNFNENRHKVNTFKPVSP